MAELPDVLVPWLVSHCAQYPTPGFEMPCCLILPDQQWQN